MAKRTVILHILLLVKITHVSTEMVDCAGYDGMVGKWPCQQRVKSPYEKPTLGQVLGSVLQPPPGPSDPRFPPHVELHGAHLVPNLKPQPWADPNFVHLHYRSRGDALDLKNIAHTSTTPAPPLPCNPNFKLEKQSTNNAQSYKDFKRIKNIGNKKMYSLYSGLYSGPCEEK